VIAPVIGHVTDAVANSPTDPLIGVHSEQSAVKVYDGFVALTALEVGNTTIVVVVPIKEEPIVLRVASTFDAAKS